MEATIDSSPAAADAKHRVAVLEAEKRKLEAAKNYLQLERVGFS
jgi:hypothetical protein